MLTNGGRGMKEDSVNNEKVRVKKVSDEVAEVESKTKELDWLKEQIKNSSNFQKLVGHFKDLDREKEIDDLLNKIQERKHGRPKKDALFFYGRLIKLVECETREYQKLYLDIIDDELKSMVLKWDGISIKEFRDILKDWVNFAIEIGKDRCENDTYADELRRELFREIDNMNEKTIRKDFLRVLDLMGEYYLKRLRKAGKVENQKEYNRTKGEIAERIMLFWFLRMLRKEGAHYVIIPYFKEHASSSSKTSKRGRPHRGQYYVDIAVIDMDNRVVGIVELKNWMGTGFYSWKDYGGGNGKAKDISKWENTERDIYRVLRYLAGEKIKNSLGVKILKGLLDDERKEKKIKKKQIWIGNVEGITEKTIEEGKVDTGLLFDLGAEELERILERQRSREQEQNTKQIRNEEKEFNDILKHVFGVSKYVLSRIEEDVREIKVGEFRIVKFWVMFRGRPIEDENRRLSSKMRRLDSKIREDFVNRGVIEIDVTPALIDIGNWSSWEIGKLVASVILEIMRKGSVVGGNSIWEKDEGDVRVIKIQWDIPIQHSCHIRIPKSELRNDGRSKITMEN